VRREVRLRVNDLDADQQAAVLRLDPIADREEYAEPAAALASSARGACASCAPPSASRRGAWRCVPPTSASIAGRCGDLAVVRGVVSFVPPGLLERATAFRQGEALAAGKICSHPALIRFRERISEEADVPATWAER
jgi:hypothetical protein